MLTRRLRAVCTSLILLALAGCQSEPTVTKSSPPTPTEVGNVAVFTPSNGINLSESTPLNTWAKFVPELTEQLEESGLDADHVTTSTASSLGDQGQQIQDYVVEAITQVDEESSEDEREQALASTTLVVAPVVETDDVTALYGGYIDGAVELTQTQDGEQTDDATPDESPDADTDETDEDAAAASHNSDVQRLISALELARSEGIHVILVSRTIESFTPDVYVSVSNAEQIGKLQAEELVSKLELDKATEDNPKSIEVLLPLASSDDADADATSDAQNLFAEQAFKGIWSVLGPYFQDGSVISPSGLLSATSTEDSWLSLVVPVTQSGDATIGQDLAIRLSMLNDTSQHTAIDGIIAMNDMAATGVMQELGDLGYTGSSADINPSISIQGIMQNITGRHDLSKSPVPDPVKKPENGSAGGQQGDESDDAVEELNARWPIVTGFGAYLSNIPQIVNGRQWMTALEDRQGIAKDMAQVVTALNQSQSPDDLSSLTQTEVDGTSVPTLNKPLIAVSAGNLKTALIDPGYITLAQAGL